MDRSRLPYRKNCEGYFLTKDGEILAKDTGKGYLVFPGGGIDKREQADNAVVRETFEETGAIIKLPVKKLGVVNFIWDKDWIKTEKQKRRFKKFKGEEMYFFFGTIKEFKENENSQSPQGVGYPSTAQGVFKVCSTPPQNCWLGKSIPITASGGVSQTNKEQQEDYWEGEKLMSILKAIRIIEKSKPFSEDIKIYREAQLRFLRKIAEKYT